MPFFALFDCMNFLVDIDNERKKTREEEEEDR